MARKTKATASTLQHFYVQQDMPELGLLEDDSITYDATNRLDPFCLHRPIKLQQDLVERALSFGLFSQDRHARTSPAPSNRSAGPISALRLVK